jgi:hypothetical protein
VNRNVKAGLPEALTAAAAASFPARKESLCPLKDIPAFIMNYSCEDHAVVQDDNFELRIYIALIGAHAQMAPSKNHDHLSNLLISLLLTTHCALLHIVKYFLSRRGDLIGVTLAIPTKYEITVYAHLKPC